MLCSTNFKIIYNNVHTFALNQQKFKDFKCNYARNMLICYNSWVPFNILLKKKTERNELS